MDVVKGTFEEWNPRLNEIELHFRLLLLAVVIITMCCCYCFCYSYYLWGNRNENAENSNADVQEVQDLELQSPNDEEPGVTEHLLSNIGNENMTSDDKDDKIHSDNREVIDENVIEDNSNEHVIINARSGGDQRSGTFSIEKDSGLNSGSKDKKGNTSNISNDSDIKSKSEDAVKPCGSSHDKIGLRYSQENDPVKLNIGGDSSKSEAASGVADEEPTSIQITKL